MATTERIIEIGAASVLLACASIPGICWVVYHPEWTMAQTIRVMWPFYVAGALVALVSSIILFALKRSNKDDSDTS